MYRKLGIVSGAAFAALLILLTPNTLTAAEPGLETDCTVLVGNAENGGPHGGVTLIVPGTLIPALEGNQWPSDISSLEEQLKSAYRLKKMRVVSQFSKLMEVDMPGKLPTADGIETTLTLVGYNDSVATYQAEMTLNGQSLASASLSVSLGGRAVMGSRLANAAAEDPYVFLVVETRSEKRGMADNKRTDGSTLPRAIQKVNPRYPEEARKHQISGEVMVQTLVKVDGSCQVIEVLESPDQILSDAATEALEQWKFEPGLDPQGKKVNMKLVLTITFKLK